MTRPALDFQLGPMPGVMPVLSQAVLDSQIPARVSADLDARLQAKADFLAMTDSLVQQMRPELERLAEELVRQSLSQAWALRFSTDLD